MSHRPCAGAALLMCAALTACPPPVPDPGPDAGEARPDACNSLDEALTLAECTLTLGVKKKAYISTAGDQDWYSFTTPADANARTLVHVLGGYPVKNTAVNLAFNLLRSDGQQSVARKTDRHLQAAPQPIDITVPFAEGNQRLVLLVSDDPVNPNKPLFDVRAEYELTVEILQDPDVNEPNDTTPTPIPLSAQGEVQVGTQMGFLSTTDDVDTFSIAGGGAKKVLYLRITGPELSPSPPFELGYTLADADGTPVAEGVMANKFLAVDLATARLAPKPPYTLTVRGELPGGESGPVPGDLRLQYAIEARVMDESDPSEGTNQNDTLATATQVAFTAVGQTRAQVGRLGYVADADWYEVRVPPSSVPTVLRWRLTPQSGPARFPPLPGFLDRDVRVMREVKTGGTAQDDVVACKNDKSICPTSYGDDAVFQGLQHEQCEAAPSRCVWSTRAEHPGFSSLRNFRGALPVAPHGATLSYLVRVSDQGQNFADDTDYALAFEWSADPDDAARYSAGAEQPEPFALQADPAAASFPRPPMGAAYEFSGRISHGPGFLRDHDPNVGEGVRGPADYDAVPSDRDRYEIALPMFAPDAGALDRTWELEWEVSHLPDGGLPYDLALELQFCDGSGASGGACTPVKVGSEGRPLTLSYTGSVRNAWHNPNAPHSERQPLYDRDPSGTETTTTANAYACNCFEARFIKGGKFYVTALGVDRTSYEDLPYTVRMAYTDYPRSYAPNAGGSQSCPPPDGGVAGGCQFTLQPN